MRQSNRNSVIKSLMDQVGKLDDSQLGGFKAEFEAYCNALIQQREKQFTQLRDALDTGVARKAIVPERAATKAAAPAKEKRSRPGKQRPARSSRRNRSPRGKAGSEEVQAKLLDALAAGPATIPELVERTGVVRITADKYVKQWLVENKVRKVGEKNRAAVYQMA